jgi:ATP-dependent Clp protease ATP-binding subunit ClpC
MSANYSNSLLVTWQVADLEAKQLHAAFLEPAHLLLGVCKCVDIDVAVAASIGDAPGRDAVLEELLREFRRLSEVFKSAGFGAMRFRRHYRTVLPEGSAGLNPAAGRLHRNDAAKDIFAEAERIAGCSGGVVFPIHLLYSLLAEDDREREKAVAAVGSNEARLRQAIKRQLFGQQDRGFVPGDQPATHWN